MRPGSTSCWDVVCKFDRVYSGRTDKRWEKEPAQAVCLRRFVLSAVAASRFVPVDHAGAG